ncbi:MAG: hypothetical protein COT06_11840 [Syntrophobacteraceae bacterium CG07_land_8_20_14_0_80_61_8]|nr:MAG: hypothetical protein COT06_11840 [Syntrophobacteraceae bacterium CG07_land_8_20_14_0_80_61_8]
MDVDDLLMEQLETISLEDHLSLDEVIINMKRRPGFLAIQKWLVIYNFIVHPRPLSQIAMDTSLSAATVYRILADYNRFGPEAFDVNRTRPVHAVAS